MGACAAQVFSNVSQGAWNCIKAKCTDAGFPINADQGSQSSNGITIAWTYSGSDGTLTITCTNSPFYVTCAMINGKIHELVDSSGCLSQ